MKVLSLPFALRYRLAFDGPLASAILGLFVRTVFTSLRRRARLPIEDRRSLQCGAVTFVQRFGDALNLNVYIGVRRRPVDERAERLVRGVVVRLVLAEAQVPGGQLRAERDRGRSLLGRKEINPFELLFMPYGLAQRSSTGGTSARRRRARRASSPGAPTLRSCRQLHGETLGKDR